MVIGIGDEKEGELEDIVKPGVGELALRQQVVKKRQPVKILLPSLDQVLSTSLEQLFCACNIVSHSAWRLMWIIWIVASMHCKLNSK